VSRVPVSAFGSEKDIQKATGRSLSKPSYEISI